MKKLRALQEQNRLWAKWVTTRFGTEPNIDRIQEVIRRELRAAKTVLRARVSDGLRSEMHGELILCGKIRKALAE